MWPYVEQQGINGAEHDATLVSGAHLYARRRPVFEPRHRPDLVLVVLLAGLSLHPYLVPPVRLYPTRCVASASVGTVGRLWGRRAPGGGDKGAASRCTGEDGANICFVSNAGQEKLSSSRTGRVYWKSR